MSDWITAEDAWTRLGVRPQTLYAYVSRGRVRARRDPDDPRRSFYSAADVDGLAERRKRSRRPADVAAGAVAWGEPVLESAITTVVEGRLYYRGRDAVELAQTETLESVARLLRGGHGAALKGAERPVPIPGPDPRARAFAALAWRASLEPPALGRNPLRLAAEAALLLDVMADAVAGAAGDGLIHERLARAWGCDVATTDLIRKALVLLADHEFNASTFAARVAASTGASLAASALAGLAALSGPRHGGAAAAFRVFADDADRRGASAAVAARLHEGRFLPGFGHPLYPNGDIRAVTLLTQFQPPPLFVELAAAVAAETGAAPNIDYALVSLAEVRRLPEDAPFALFAVGRCAGWIAHAIEQGQSAAIIRPRARYVGPRPA